LVGEGRAAVGGEEVVPENDFVPATAFDWAGVGENLPVFEFKADGFEGGEMATHPALPDGGTAVRPGRASKHFQGLGSGGMGETCCVLRVAWRGSVERWGWQMANGKWQMANVACCVRWGSGSGRWHRRYHHRCRHRRGRG